MPGFLKIEPSSRRVAIAGRVTDAQTGRALGGVQVAITAGPPAFTSRLPLQAAQHGSRWDTMATRADRTRTSADGYFHFMDLPTGRYTLTASMPGAGSRYGSANVEATLSRSGAGRDPEKIAAAVADIALSPTTLKGRITASDAKQPLLLAEVSIQGSGERAFSDAQGNYLLTALEVGTRTVAISARGYQAVSSTVELRSPGDAQRLDVALLPAR